MRAGVTGPLRLTVAAFLALALAACAANGAQPTPAGTPAVTVDLTAHDTAFDESTLEVPAGETFAIQFDNEDGLPHNVSIHGNGEARNGDVFTGPGQRTYVFAGLPPGTYTFQCDIHPTTMTGTFVVGSSGIR